MDTRFNPFSQLQELADKPKTNDEIKEAIAKLYSEKFYTITAICKELKVSDRRVTSTLAELGLRQPTVRCKREDVVDQVIHLLSLGVPMRTISKEVNCSLSLVLKISKEHRDKIQLTKGVSLWNINIG